MNLFQFIYCYVELVFLVNSYHYDVTEAELIPWNRSLLERVRLHLWWEANMFITIFLNSPNFFCPSIEEKTVEFIGSNVRRNSDIFSCSDLGVIRIKFCSLDLLILFFPLYTQSLTI